jgi:hypothetical protein
MRIHLPLADVSYPAGDMDTDIALAFHDRPVFASETADESKRPPARPFGNCLTLLDNLPFLFLLPKHKQTMGKHSIHRHLRICSTDKTFLSTV